MASVWGELKRRNVVKVAVAYAIVAWLLVQVIVSVEAPLSLPDWTDTLVLVFLLIGFVVAMFLAWAYELTPEGVKQTKTVPLSESVAKVTGRRLDFAIIGALALALGFVVVDNYVLGDRGSSVLPNSVAVLPFENVSPNPNDAYIATGIHEEILNQLVKLSALNVIARTSVQQYANTQKPIPEIAAELNVETVMEGSVRYANGQIRITAQLNDGITGAHLWSETYTRDFEDIFAIESDVAMNVANALETEFSLAERESLERPPTTSTAAYQFYLRALVVTGTSSGAFLTADERSLANAYLDQALAIDPQFALAYARKSRIAPITSNPAPARLLAERALEIDPNLGLAHVAVAFAHTRAWRRAEARKAYERALDLSPNDPVIISDYGLFLAYVEEYDDAIRLTRYATILDPNNWALFANLGGVLQLAGDIDAAADALLQSTMLNPLNLGPIQNLARLEAGRGNEADAVRYLQTAEELSSNGAFIAHGYALAGQRDRAIEFATRSRAAGPGGASYEALVSLILGEREKALEFLELYVDHQRPLNFGIMRVKYNVWPDPALNEPEFVEVRQRIVFAE